MMEKSNNEESFSEAPLQQQADPLVAELAELLLARKATMTTAESCTGGLIAGALTAMPAEARVVRTGSGNVLQQGEAVAARCAGICDRGARCRQRSVCSGYGKRRL